MRLFTGIAINPQVLDKLELVMRELRPLAPLNWSPTENLHITSKFIGHWPDARLDEISDALTHFEPPACVTITVAHFGFFPNARRPRVLFAGIDAGPELAQLAHGIEEALVPLGVAREERPYAPHLTLARIKPETPAAAMRELQARMATMANSDFGTFEATRFHLYQSKPGPRGSVYTALASWPLRAASGREA